MRLSPLYDAASTLVYPRQDYDPDSIQLAMSIGGQNRLRYIGSREWRKLADDVGLPRGEVLARVGELAERFGPAVDEVCGDSLLNDLAPEMTGRLRDVLVARGAQCAALSGHGA